VRYVPSRRVMRRREPMRGVTESYHYRLQPFVHMYATSEAIRRLEQDPEVVKIYADMPVHAYLDHSAPHIEVPRLWNDGLTGENVRIAIVDTGIDTEHPDFQGRIGAITDFTGEGPADGNGHGTHCASIAAGSGAARGAKYRGVAPAAAIFAAKVLRSDGQGMMSDVMAGVEWAVDQGTQVISLSLGTTGPCDGTDALCETCEAAVRAGIIVCIAAGNDGPNSYTVGSPGCAPNVLTIGACDNADRIAAFSSRGPTADGRVKPDILFPGVNIVAARAKGTAMGTVLDDYYTSASGTSMATPHAAGVAALLLQAQPDLTPAQIKGRLMNTAIDLGASANAQGSGRADAWQARNAADEPTPEPTPVPTTPPTPGQGCLPLMVRVLFLGRK
jgi:serine protease AprX